MNTDPNMSEQLGQNQSTTMEITKKKQVPNPDLSNRETDLTRIHPRMWWEQISEHIDLTYHNNLEDLMDHGIEGMDAHTIYHIKGNIIRALGLKAKHEIMRG